MLTFIPSLIVAIAGPLGLYAVSLLFFGLLACFSKKHRKHALKVLALLVRARVRSG